MAQICTDNQPPPPPKKLGAGGPIYREQGPWRCKLIFKGKANGQGEQS